VIGVLGRREEKGGRREKKKKKGKRFVSQRAVDLVDDRTALVKKNSFFFVSNISGRRLRETDFFFPLLLPLFSRLVGRQSSDGQTKKEKGKADALPLLSDAGILWAGGK